MKRLAVLALTAGVGLSARPAAAGDPAPPPTAPPGMAATVPMVPAPHLGEAHPSAGPARLRDRFGAGRTTPPGCDDRPGPFAGLSGLFSRKPKEYVADPYDPYPAKKAWCADCAPAARHPLPPLPPGVDLGAYGGVRRASGTTPVVTPAPITTPAPTTAPMPAPAPVSPLPATTRAPAPAPAAVVTALPAPTMMGAATPAVAGCADGACPRPGRAVGHRDRSCWDCFTGWLCYRQTPNHLPMKPTQREAPLYTYGACYEGRGHAGAGCAGGKCGPGPLAGGHAGRCGPDGACTPCPVPGGPVLPGYRLAQPELPGMTAHQPRAAGPVASPVVPAGYKPTPAATPAPTVPYRGPTTPNPRPFVGQ